jgi:hypothetical protein
MRYFLTSFILLATAAAAGRGEEPKFDATRLAKMVSPFVEEGTFLVVHVDLARLDPDKLAARVAAATGLRPEDLAPLASEADRKRLRALVQAGARDLFFVLGMADLFTKGGAMVLPLGEGVEKKAVIAAMGRKYANPVQAGAALLAGDRDTVERLRKNQPVAHPELADSFAAAGDATVGLVFLIPPDTPRIYEETLPDLPADLGGGPMKVYTRGIRWAALGIDTAPALRLRLTIGSPDEAAAKDLAAALADRLLPALAKMKAIGELVPTADKIVPLLTPKAKGDRLTLVLDEKELGEIVKPSLSHLWGSFQRKGPTNRLHQILIALHQYLDANGRFPAAAIYDKEKKPLLSWRVQLLPFLGETDLYKQFHLDEPWDSEHNKKLIEKMPKVFDSTADPKLAAAGKTTFLAPRGAATMFPDRRGVRLSEVTDGTSNTIFLVDADDAHAVPWTKPEELAFDPKEPAKGLSTRFGDGFLVGFVDGSVHFLPKKLPKETLRALFTRNGGEVANYP